MLSAKCRHQLSSGRFSATSIASFRERLLDFRSCWSLYSHSTRMSKWSPPVLQRGKLLRSSWHLFCDNSTMWPNQERGRAWTTAKRCSCPVARLTSSLMVPFDSQQISQTPLIDNINLLWLQTDIAISSIQHPVSFSGTEHFNILTAVLVEVQYLMPIAD